MTQHVMVGLSGGVDSAVAALLLKEQGYRVSGLFMKNWEEDDSPGHCSATEDLAMASAVAEQLQIPLQTVNFSTEYWDRVFEHFLREYAAGRTPNPDVLCNREIKFRAFLDHALGLGADLIATGHYAKLQRDQLGTRLYCALDDDKDQTYFLYMVGSAALDRSLFPLGAITKPQVRELARQHRLPNHQRKDSTGICFIGERRFSEFLRRYLPATPGEITDPQGHVLGQHDGLMYYTLGQRRGMGIGGTQDGSEQPWFVAEKDLEHNRLIVVQGHDHPLLFSHSLIAGQLHWVSDRPPPSGLHCLARCRHRQSLQSCRIEQIDDGLRLQIHFEQPQRAITPGQSVVLYLGQECLGGGIIEQRQGLTP